MSLRYAITSLLGLVVLILSVAYFTAPYLLSRFLPDYLQTLGVEHSQLLIARPGLRHTHIEVLRLTVSGMEIQANEVELQYHFSGLLDRRLDGITMTRLAITLPESAAESTDEALPSPLPSEFPSPWAEIPADRLVITHFELNTTSPVASLAGNVSMTPTVATANLRVSSDLLPTLLNIDLQLLPTGDLTLAIAHQEAQPSLAVSVHHNAAGVVEFNGDLQLSGPALEFVSELAGINQAAGVIKGSFKAAGTWPIRRVGDLAGNGKFKVDYSGNVNSVSGLSYEGLVDVVLEPNQLRVAAAGSTLALQSIDGSQGRYVFKDSQTDLSYRAQIPLADGVPDLSLATGDAELNLSINLPGKTRISDALSLDGIKVNGVLNASIDTGSQRLAGKLSVLPEQFDYQNIPYQLHGENLKLDLDLSAPRADVTHSLLPTDGSLVAEIITTISSSARQAPFRQLAMDVGLQVLLNEDDYRLTIASNSLVNVLMGEQDFGFEALNEISVEVGPDGQFASHDAALSSRFSLDVGEEQRVSYTGARLNIDSFQMYDDLIGLTGRFRADSSSNALPMEISLKANSGSASGSFELNTRHVIKRQVFRKELPGWNANYELSGGQIELALSGEFDLSDKPQFYASGELSLKQGVAQANDIAAADLNAQLPIKLDNNNFLIGPGPVQIGTVDVGFPASDIAFQLQADIALAKITDLSARLLMADITIDELVYDIEAESAQFPVQVSGLPVASVLALEGDDVQGDGILDGLLPVVVFRNATSITAGSFAARPPGGYLRYRGDMPTTNPGLDLAIRALRNFEYTDMNIGVDYAPDGALAALIRLQGSNPDVENGRAIHFNLNVTEDIPALLESIRASEAAQERIQQRLSR